MSLIHMFSAPIHCRKRVGSQTMYKKVEILNKKGKSTAEIQGSYDTALA